MFDRHLKERNRSRNGDHRSPYYDSRRHSTGCRNHGDCDWCEGNRTFANRRRAPIVDNEFVEIVL